MTGTARQDRGAGRRRAREATGDGQVIPLDLAAIQRALARRHRYKYVQPRVEPEGEGWKIVSPNCSRTVDPAGGDIDVAWLVRGAQGWRVHARDHAAGTWIAKSEPLPLAKALALLCEDTNREFWQ
jgi:hypothetical protein